MPLWRIEPVAAVDDPRWLDHPIWAEVLVRAATAAQARLIAARHAHRHRPESVGNESAAARSGFDDEKLYRVVQVDPTRLPSVCSGSGPAEVVRAVRLKEAGFDGR